MRPLVFCFTLFIILVWHTFHILAYSEIAIAMDMVS